MNNLLEKRIGKMIGEIEDFVTPIRIDVTGWKTKKCGYKTGNVVPSPDTSDWSIFGETERWGTEPDEHRWFFKHIDIPAELKGKDIELYVAASTPNRSIHEPQFLIYLDGVEIRGLDSNHRYIKLDSEKSGYDVNVYAFSCPSGMRVDFYTQLCAFNREVEKLYYNLNTPYEVMEYLTEEDKEFCDIRTYLNNALNLLNWCDPLSDEFNASVANANNYLETEFYGKYCREQDIKISCVGHTHIDLAWRWTVEQTREKAQRTFGSVIEMMKKYPDYIFMSSQPQLLKFLKEEAPDMYAEVKKLVKEKRIELEGAMWVEADCNLSSGESLVRQILFGKRFFKEEFGVDNKIVWLPDVFGYSAAMPQIMQKSGVDKFVTSKIAWNETNRMPYDTFMWKGIDGTKIFTYFLTAVERTRKFEKMGWRSTYTPELDPPYVQGTWDRYEPKFLNKELLMPFGFGDGGGGPADLHIENFERIKYGINGCPQVKWEFASSYLERKKKEFENNKRLPEWSGELYLEFHRGTYTSQARNKRSNRKSEQLYQNTELMSSMATKLFNAEYPQEKLNDGWECILFNQFHDIIPGSSIHPVYERCKKDYAAIKKNGDELLQKAYATVLSNIKTDGGVAVFNQNSFVSNGYLQYNGKTYRVCDVPSKGYKVMTLQDGKAEYKLSGKHLETSNYIVDFADDYTITRLYDKKNDREVLRQGGRGNYIEAFEDYPYEYDAWEISNYYTEKCYEINDISEVTFIDEGARFGFEITRKFYKSFIKQKIYFYDGSNRIDFDTYADWHQEHLMLKAAFDVDVNSDKATYEIQFGSVERAVHKNTSWDAAKFEVCAHKYIDYSDYGYGVSLINDCKYGHNIENGTMKLSMFKCATSPDPDADKGEHKFVYSILPHAGNYRQSGTVQLAYELNYPLAAFDVKKQDGSLNDEYSFVSCNSDNFIVETVKKAEDSKSLIIRGYESYNKRTNVELKFGFDVNKAFICDLMENNETEITVQKNMISFNANPFEIITVKID